MGRKKKLNVWELQNRISRILENGKIYMDYHAKEPQIREQFLHLVDIARGRSH